MHRTSITAGLVAALVLGLLAGCSSASDNAGASTELKKPDTTAKMGKGDNVDQSGATQVSDPSTIKQGGSYKLAPANPDDPIYKTDPKLGGGG